MFVQIEDGLITPNEDGTDGVKVVSIDGKEIDPQGVLQSVGRLGCTKGKCYL